MEFHLTLFRRYVTIKHRSNSAIREALSFGKQALEEDETNGLSAGFVPTEPLPGRGGTERSRELG